MALAKIRFILVFAFTTLCTMVRGTSTEICSSSWKESECPPWNGRIIPSMKCYKYCNQELILLPGLTITAVLRCKGMKPPECAFQCLDLPRFKSLELLNCRFLNFDMGEYLGKAVPPFLTIKGDDGQVYPIDIKFDNILPLQVLTLSNLTTGGKFSIEFNEMDSIAQLSIEDHDFRKFPPRSFQDLEYLIRLYIVRGLLAKVDRDFLYGLRMLGNLDLSFNKIRYLDERAFVHVSMLFTLDLSHNEISYIEAEMFSSLKNLRYLALDHNPLLTVPHNLRSYLPKLETLKT